MRPSPSLGPQTPASARRPSPKGAPPASAGAAAAGGGEARELLVVTLRVVIEAARADPSGTAAQFDAAGGVMRELCELLAQLIGQHAASLDLLQARCAVRPFRSVRMRV